MAFDTYELSAESGAPVETYHFSVGSEDYYYTSDPNGFTFLSQPYLARQISRTAPSQSQEDRRTQLEVKLPTEDPVAARFIGIVPGAIMSLTITRFHRGDTEAFIVWSGSVTGSAFGLNGAECTLRCVTSEASFSRTIPRYKYSSLCNHILFDNNCGVDKDLHKFAAICSAVSGNVITIPGLFAGTTNSNTWAQGGYANFNDADFRLVTSQHGDDITLFLPFENNPLGQSVTIYAGCDHSIGTCKGSFGNVVNFGGFPWVPTENVFITGLG